MSRHSGSLCQEVMQLPGPDPTVLRVAVVPLSASIRPIERDAKEERDDVRDGHRDVGRVARYYRNTREWLRERLCEEALTDEA